jgi:hypothetical protein
MVTYHVERAFEGREASAFGVICLLTSDDIRRGLSLNETRRALVQFRVDDRDVDRRPRRPVLTGSSPSATSHPGSRSLPRSRRDGAARSEWRRGIRERLDRRTSALPWMQSWRSTFAVLGLDDLRY